MTENEIKILYQYQIAASLLMEQFTYAAPVLRKIESSNYHNRAERKKAMKQYDKDILDKKRWLLNTAQLIERTHNDEIENVIDQFTELFNQINIVTK